MTAWLATDESKRPRRQLGQQFNDQTPEEFLLDTVQSYMTNNQTSYRTDTLLHVAYVEERNLQINNIDPEVFARPISNVAEEEAATNSKYVGIGVAGIFIAILLAGLMYTYREERQRRLGQVDNDAEMDMEGGNVQASGKEGNDSSSSDSLEDGDGAFPTVVNPLDSMAVSDGGSVGSLPKLLLNESNISNESSIPPSLDPNVPTDNLFGLEGKVCSDEYPVPPSKEDELDVFHSTTMESQPVEQMKMSSIDENKDREDDDSPVSSLDIAGDDSISQDSSENSPRNDPNWAGVVNTGPDDDESPIMDVNLSPSEATEKMSNTAPFIVENGSSDIEDGLESDDEEEDNPRALPSLV
jgi:hypothetical protein